MTLSISFWSHTSLTHVTLKFPSLSLFFFFTTRSNQKATRRQNTRALPVYSSRLHSAPTCWDFSLPPQIQENKQTCIYSSSGGKKCSARESLNANIRGLTAPHTRWYPFLFFCFHANQHLQKKGAFAWLVWKGKFFFFQRCVHTTTLSPLFTNHRSIALHRPETPSFPAAYRERTTPAKGRDRRAIDLEFVLIAHTYTHARTPKSNR